MVTSGSQVGNRKFQGHKVWEPAVPCHGNLWFPSWEPSVPTFRNRKFFAMVTYGSQVGKHEFQTSGNRQLLAMVTHGSQVGNQQQQQW